MASTPRLCRAPGTKFEADAMRAYFVANGWPTNMDGTLKVIGRMGMDELIPLVRRFGLVLQDEFKSITPGKKP